MDSTNTILTVALAYTYLCGGYMLLNLTNPPKKLALFLSWPFIPIYVLGGLFFASQEDVDNTIDEYDNDDRFNP